MGFVGGVDRQKLWAFINDNVIKASLIRVDQIVFELWKIEGLMNMRNVSFEREWTIIRDAC